MLTKRDNQLAQMMTKKIVKASCSKRVSRSSPQGDEQKQKCSEREQQLQEPRQSTLNTEPWTLDVQRKLTPVVAPVLGVVQL